MYANDSHFPDGLTPAHVDALLIEVFGSADPMLDAPAPDLSHDAPAVRSRQHRRTVRRTAHRVVRLLSVRPAPSSGAPDGEAA
jgi:hypothetical protein